MKNIKIIYVVLALVLLLSSCSIGRFTHQNSKATSFAPDEVRLELTMDDFDYLGDVQISISQKTYFGIFSKLDTINGVFNDNRHYKKFVKLKGTQDFPIKGRLKRAAYKVVEQYPDADYFVPVSSYKEVQRMFLGSRKTKTMTIRAYKLKK